MADTFWDRVVKTAGCWLWVGYIADNGYGKTSKGWAHRIAYERLVGPIPDGAELDHLCRIRNCVNPAHLEPVTHAENMRRAVAARGSCGNGHRYDERNTYVTPSGRRMCRACKRDAARRYRGARQ